MTGLSMVHKILDHSNPGTVSYKASWSTDASPRSFVVLFCVGTRLSIGPQPTWSFLPTC